MMNSIRKQLIYSKSFLFLVLLIKNGNCDVTTKTQITIWGLTNSREIIKIEITISRKYMKKPTVLPMIRFQFVYLLSFGVFILVFTLPKS